jgi:acetyl-CoA carboxylase carboxyltransferase component
MTWEKEVNRLRHQQGLAKQMGGEEAIAKQHARRRLTVRERINLLLDPNSFREIGTIAGNASYDHEGNLKSFTHAARVIGHGTINDRLVCVEGGDFTISGGWADPMSFASIGGFTPEKMALEWRTPFIRLLDSAGGSVKRIEEMGRSFLLGNPNRWVTPAALMAQVPVVAATLGSLGGYPPVEAAAAHWSIMTKNTSELFVAGPPLVKQALGIDITKEELGGHKVHVFQSGVIDNLAEDEPDALQQIRRFLSYFPQNVWQQPPRVETGDSPDRRDEGLLSIIPKNRKRQYDIRQLIRHIFDKDSIFELAPFYGRSLVTTLARMDGYPVAVISNDCKWYGGAQTAAGCEKMMRFIDLADTFHLPIIYLVDCPGFMIGPESEKEGIERKAARLAFALTQTTVPGLSIIIRRSFGVAGALHGSISRLNLRYAWPSGEWGSLPAEGGVMAAYRSDIEAAHDPETKRVEIENRLVELSSPFRTAEAFGVEEIIDPRDTRPILCQFVKIAQGITATQLGPKSRTGIRP